MAKNKKRKQENGGARQQIHSKNSSLPESKPNKPSIASAKATSTPRQAIPPTIPFETSDRILLVGEGDFSFARSLVEEHQCYDVTATCLDSQEDLYKKYDPQAEENTQYLIDAGQTVLYNIDATKLDQSKSLSKLLTVSNGNHGEDNRFNHILFNFPHIGGKSTDVNRQVRANQELLVKFFSSAKPLLASSRDQNASLVVTLFEGEPYTLWNIRDLARHAGLTVLKSFRFQSEAYPGYRHARTLGNLEGGGAWRGEDREARSYVFVSKDGEMRKGGSNLAKDKKRKRGKDGESSGEDV